MSKLSRRDFVKMAGMTAAGAVLSGMPGVSHASAQAPVVGSRVVSKPDGASHAKVYFTKHIDAEHLLKLYSLLMKGFTARWR